MRILVGPETKKARTVPARAGDQAGDLRQAFMGLALVGEAILHDRDVVAIALPLPNQNGPGLYPARHDDLAGRLGVLRHELLQQPGGRGIEATIGGRLDAISNGTAQKIGTESYGRLGFELRAPQRAKFCDPHGSEPIDLGFDPGVNVERHQAARFRFGAAVLARLPPLASTTRYTRFPSVSAETRLRPSFVRTTPAKNPCTECFCQPVAFMTVVEVTPSVRRSKTMTRSCLDCGRDADRAFRAGLPVDGASLRFDAAVLRVAASLAGAGPGCFGFDWTGTGLVC